MIILDMGCAELYGFGVPDIGWRAPSAFASSSSDRNNPE